MIWSDQMQMDRRIPDAGEPLTDYRLGQSFTDPEGPDRPGKTRTDPDTPGKTRKDSERPSEVKIRLWVNFSSNQPLECAKLPQEN